mmetsp:Transcript_68987/g.133118  ORF Transcript_68987/g.133118 Transcript_68987/m.133118 type:complete len:148 (+) Transcript_68987:503-946(+)
MSLPSAAAVVVVLEVVVVSVDVDVVTDVAVEEEVLEVVVVLVVLVAVLVVVVVVDVTVVLVVVVVEVDVVVVVGTHWYCAKYMKVQPSNVTVSSAPLPNNLLSLALPDWQDEGATGTELRHCGVLTSPPHQSLLWSSPAGPQLPTSQ